MERLTKRLEDGQAVIDCKGCSESWNTNPNGKCTALYCRNMLKDHLAAYEDTGLEPDQIAETIWRLRDYFDADREGRLIVLPCEGRIDRENLANRIERMVVRDDCLIGVSSGEKKLAYAITSALRSEE